MIEAIKKIVSNMLENSKLSKLEFGTVERVEPLKIRIDQKKVINASQLMLSHLVRDYYVDITVQHSTDSIYGDWDTSHTHPGAGKNVIPIDHEHEYKGRKKIMMHYSLKKGEKLVVKGKHFLYNMNYKENWQTVLKLKERYTPDVTILNVEDNNDKVATFIIPDSDNVFEDYPYEITITNDIGQESAPFNQEINIEERVPTSTPLSVIKAVVVKKDVPLYKTVDITFNRMIRDASIKAFVFPKLTNSIILYGYRSKIATSITLSDDQYNYLVNELPKGYVIIKENGKEYKAEFSLEKGN